MMHYLLQKQLNALVKILLLSFVCLCLFYCKDSYSQELIGPTIKDFTLGMTGKDVDKVLKKYGYTFEDRLDHFILKNNNGAVIASINFDKGVLSMIRFRPEIFKVKMIDDKFLNKFFDSCHINPRNFKINQYGDIIMMRDVNGRYCIEIGYGVVNPYIQLSKNTQ